MQHVFLFQFSASVPSQTTLHLLLRVEEVGDRHEVRISPGREVEERLVRTDHYLPRGQAGLDTATWAGYHAAQEMGGAPRLAEPGSSLRARGSAGA